MLWELHSAYRFRAKPAARSLTGGTGRRRGFVNAVTKESAEAAYEGARPEGANRSFGGRRRGRRKRQ